MKKIAQQSSYTNPEKLKRTVVIISDETVYEMWIKLKIDVGALEQIGTKIGVFLATDMVSENIKSKLNRNRKLDTAALMAWKAKIDLDNDVYHAFLKKFSDGLNVALSEIETESETLTKVLKKLDSGISTTDINLLANAYWIRLKTHYEPFILSDDGDLLASAHMLASFFGISFGCISSFEAVRLAEISEHFDEFCSYLKLPGKYGDLSKEWSHDKLEKCVSEVLRKGLLSCHIDKVTSRLIKRNASELNPTAGQ